MNIPNDLLYSKDHEWIKIENGIATIGITDYAQSELGDIVFVEFPDVDESFDKDDTFGTVEAVKTVADLFSPISGTIVEINETLEDEPELINSSPYEDGWLIKIKCNDTSECDLLLDSDTYKGII